MRLAEDSHDGEAATPRYDEVPSESYPFAQTHPDRLATVATLLGLKPAPVERCRVLELGCAAGGNLLPMAVTLPDSTFVGIDLSSRQLADGQKIVDDLGLKNVTLQHRSILEVTPDFGRFDYIICHGVWSWVPRDVRDKILAVCHNNLAPNGIAYVSYNTYPGWHLRGMIRDMMCYHAQHFTDPHVRVRQARNLLDFLARSVAGEQSPFSLLLKAELDMLRGKADSYLFHEHLEDCNEPVYFHQFVARAEECGLRYLGDVDLRVMTPGNFPREVESVLQMLSPDLIHLEQYMDFLRNRTFRQTLLCQQALLPNYALRPAQLVALHIASSAKPVSEKLDLHSEQAVEFRGADGVTLSAREPLVKAAMLHLTEVWPEAVSFEEVRKAARARLGATVRTDAEVQQDREQLGQTLLRCYTSATSLAELHVAPPRLTRQASAQPLATALARYQAATGPQVTNLRHELVTLGDFERHILRHLDGQHDRAALVEALAGLVEQDALTVQENGVALRDGDRLREILARTLEQQLPQLARSALLVR